MVDLSRRDFMLAGTTSLLALDGAVADAVDAQAASSDEYEFDGVADLIGPLDARPAPGDPFFDHKLAYAYRYDATDGGRYYITEDDSAWQNISIMEKYETGFGFPAVRTSANRIDAPAAYDFNTGRHQLVVNGSTITDPSTTSAFVDADGAWQLTPSGGQRVEFGVREPTRYVPNYELLWGCAAWAENTLSSGQRFYIEFTDDDRANGYRYRFEPSEWYVEQLSGGNTVASHALGDWETDPRENGFDLTEPFVARDYLNWYGAGSSRFTLSFPDADGRMVNDTIDRTYNPDGIATERINNRVKVVAEADVGAGSFTVNVGSFGTLIQGDAQQYDREKIGTHYGLGGAISEYPAENDPVLALRVDPERANVAVQLPTPVFAPSGNPMEMTVHGVLPADTDADFLDVDGDGTNEGPVYAAQTQPENNVLQWTRNVSTFPTTAGQRMDNTAGPVVDARQIASAVSAGSGNKNEPPVPSTGSSISVKRTLYPGEVALFIPRAFPGSGVTSGSIDFIQDFSEQDW